MKSGLVYQMTIRDTRKYAYAGKENNIAKGTQAFVCDHTYSRVIAQVSLMPVF